MGTWAAHQGGLKLGEVGGWFPREISSALIG